jgi:DNA-binding NarL/FixJ family response regulator
MGHTVLIVDDDPFELRYVTAVLAASGVAVTGPFADASAVLAAAGEPHLSAAVIRIGGLFGGPPPWLVELERRGIACLFLAGSNDPLPALDGRAVLAGPFAAYQIADWVASVSGERLVAAG